MFNIICAVGIVLCNIAQILAEHLNVFITDAADKIRRILVAIFFGTRIFTADYCKNRIILVAEIRFKGVCHIDIVLCNNGVFQLTATVKGEASDRAYLIAQNNGLKIIAISKRFVFYRFQILRRKEIFKGIALIKCTASYCFERAVIRNIQSFQRITSVKHFAWYLFYSA